MEGTAAVLGWPWLLSEGTAAVLGWLWLLPEGRSAGVAMAPESKRSYASRHGWYGAGHRNAPINGQGSAEMSDG